VPFTIKFVKLLFGVPFIVVLSWLWPPLLLIAVAYAIALVLLLLWDRRKLPGRNDLQFSRRLDPTIGIGSEKTYVLDVRNRTGSLAPYEIVDTLPPEIAVTDSLLDGETQECRVKALERGEFEIGPVYTRFVGALGLAERRFTFEGKQTIRVIPSTPAIGEQRLRRGALRAAGNRRLRLSGRGDEFESLRFYQADDDPRHIDWRSTARKGKLLTRSYQPESKQRVLIALDLGRTMLGRSEDIGKADAVLNHCLLMAHTALAEGDSIGFLAFSDKVLARMPISAGKRQIHQLLEISAHLDAAPVESDYRLLLRELSIWERKRSLLILFTDFLDETQTEDLRAALMTLGKKHRILVVAVRDPELYALATLSPKSADEAFATAAAAHLVMHRQMAVRALQHAGIMVADLEHQELAAGIVEKYLRLREAAIF
jgi:uncharacterized protein (DUF58 family)